MNMTKPKPTSSPQPQPLLTGLAFCESPRWHEDRLWFSDWGAQEVIAVDRQGNSEVITHVRAFPFCLAFLPDGRPLIVAGQRLLRIEPGGLLVTHADLADLSDYDWNDIVVDGRGNAYVNNAGLGFQGGLGTIALVTPDGTARQVAEGIAFPNGMAVTPDNATLIVAESVGKKLTAFAIAPDGGLSNQRLWAALSDFGPDGICLDADNAVWCGSGKRCVRVREGGEVLQGIDLELFCTACTLGGPDKRMLLMTVVDWRGDATLAEIEQMQKAIKAGVPAEWPGERTGQVLTVEVPVAGAGWP
jgi:sugar lactone lactonase YvrE